MINTFAKCTQAEEIIPLLVKLNYLVDPCEETTAFISKYFCKLSFFRTVIHIHFNNASLFLKTTDNK
jgi:hypothetical protein